MLSVSLNKNFPSNCSVIEINLESVLYQVGTYTTGQQLCQSNLLGVRFSFMVESPFMVQWVIGLMVDSLNYFSFQPVLHNWYSKDCGMCCPVCGSSPCSVGSRFLLSLSELLFTVYLDAVNKMY